VALTVDKLKSQNYYNTRGNKGMMFAAGAVAGMVFTVGMWLLLIIGLTPRSLANLIAKKLPALCPPASPKE